MCHGARRARPDGSRAGQGHLEWGGGCQGSERMGGRAGAERVEGVWQKSRPRTPTWMPWRRSSRTARIYVCVYVCAYAYATICVYDMYSCTCIGLYPVSEAAAQWRLYHLWGEPLDSRSNLRLPLPPALLVRFVCLFVCAPLHACYFSSTICHLTPYRPTTLLLLLYHLFVAACPPAAPTSPTTCFHEYRRCERKQILNKYNHTIKMA